MAPVATDVVKLLRETQLLDEEHLEELTHLAPAYPDGTALTADLIRRGWLTSYQLEHLDHGTPQDLLIGPYVLLEELGQGGMGTVYKARHRRLDRVVALKVINPLVMSGEAVERFQREARAIARLKHPNIVLLYDAGESDGKQFLALEYVEGVDLEKLLQRGPLPIALACDCIRQAALGLQHAHERGLVHRDIKPSNLVLTRGGRAPHPLPLSPGGRGVGGEGRDDAPENGPAQEGLVKILDLGLARMYSEGRTPPSGTKISLDGFVVGTPDYLAPEQALDSHTVDIRADIYSLGCTFYELLTGETPFAAVANGAQKLLSHLQDQPPPLEQLRPDVPAGVVAVVRKMMAKEPKDRFQTPGEVAEALAPFVKFRPPARAADNAAPPASAARQDRRGGATGGVRAPSLGWAKALALYTDPPTELVEHQGAVRCLAFSPSGGHALSGGEDQTVNVWDVLAARKVHCLAGHTGAVLCVAFAPNGRTAISGGSDHALMLWDVESGQKLARFVGQTAEVCTAAFSPDGKFVLTGGKDQTLHLWEVASRRYLRALGGVIRGRHFDAVAGVAFSPDGARAVSASLDKTLRLWNVKTGKEVHCFEGHTDKVYCVAFSPDGIHAASGGRDRTVRLWGVVSGQEIRRLEGHTRSVRGVAFAPGGRQLLTGGDTTIRLWEVATGREMFTATADAQKVLCVAMTADGSHLLAAGTDGVVRLWAKAT